MFKKPIMATLLATTLFPALAQAKNTAEAIIVTATRTAQTADETLASVTVITREQIEQTSPHSLPELLMSVTGGDITTNGGMGKASSLHLRGTSGSHILVMIDGVKIGSATLGTPALQDLPVAQIERIEIVRGPQSSLYGSEAIGGIIQIFTRKGRSGHRQSVTVGIGRYDTRELSLNFNGAANSTHYNLGLSRLKTEGFDARSDASEPDNDGYQNDSFNLKVGHQFKDGSQVDAFILQARGENEYDGWTNESKTRQVAKGVDFNAQPTDIWYLGINLSQSRDESDEFSNGSYMSTINTKRNLLTLQNDLAVTDSQLFTIGYEHQKDMVEGTVGYGKDSRLNRAVFAQHQMEFGPVNMELGLRHDNNQQFGSKNTGHAAIAGELSEGLRASLSYGTAFKAPTFNDLYWPGSGNEDLKPESSKSWELGLNKHFENGMWDLRAYRTTIEDLIQWACTIDCDDADWSNDIWQPINVDSARIRGVEATYSHRFDQWQTALSGSWLKPEDEASGNILIRRTQKSAMLRLDRDYAAGHAGISLLHKGRSFDDAANNNEIAAYTLLNIYASYQINENLVIRGKVDNLFDRDYQTALSYNSEGRNLFVSLTFQR